MKSCRCLFVLMLCTMNLALAQRRPTTEIDLATLADDLTGFQDQDANYDELYENQAQILSHPIDLNTTRAEDLRMMFVLTERQITQFLQYRQDQGTLNSIYELQVIPEFDLETIYKLLPFVEVTDPDNELNKAFLKRIWNDGKTYVITRYEKTFQAKKGSMFSVDDPNRFTGTADKYYLRFRNSKPGDFSLGFTAEKDPGERWRWDPPVMQYGFDYLSFHAQVVNKKRIKNLIIGDFQCQFAQGLILGGAFGLGKGAETIATARKSNIGFLPYTSVNESRYYRGIAATYALTKNVFASVFYSGTNRDAAVHSGNTDSATVSSFQYSGLHRNEKELNNRKRTLEQSWGIVFNLRKGNLDAGLIAQGIHLAHQVNKSISAYNQFAFNGEENINTGIFLDYSFYNFNFFSEAARSVDGGSGVIAGVISALHKNVDLSFSFRRYEKDYYPFYANAFAESSQPQNETGFYWGLKYQWKRKYSLAGYADLFKFPWLGFRRYTPSSGHEWLLRMNYQFNRKTMAFLQVREEVKSRNAERLENLYGAVPVIKRNYCVNLDYGVHSGLKFKSRAQYSTFLMKGQRTHGFVLLQDINFSWGKFQLTARHALFDTQDFDNRQYVYENDVWLAYSLPAYDGAGARNYVLLEYKVNKHLSWWVRYSRTRYTDREEIGSGPDGIRGKIKDDIKIQMMLKW